MLAPQMFMVRSAVLLARLVAGACTAPAGSPDGTSRVPSFGRIAPPTPTPRGEPSASPQPSARAAAPAQDAVFWLEAPIAGDPSPFRAVVPLTGAVAEAGRAR